MGEFTNVHEASPANPLNNLKVTGISISNQCAPPLTYSTETGSSSSRSRGTLIRKPYAINTNSAFARYDIHGREKPSALRSTGHSPGGMQGIICVGHGSGSLNPAFITTETKSQDHPLSQNGPIVLGTGEKSVISPNRQYKTIRPQDISANRYNVAPAAGFNAGKVVRSKTPLSHSDKSPHNRPKNKRAATATPRMMTPEVSANDVHPVPMETPPKPPVSPINVRQSGSTLGMFEENHSTKLSNYFCQLYKHDQLTDILVHVGSYSFSAHKTMLCCFSPYLATAILRSPETKELYLSDTITPTGFKKILDYMYTKELSIEVENLAEILQAATVLSMPQLNEQCKEILESAKIPALLDILETSHKQGVQGVLQSPVITKICNNFTGIYKFTEFLELCQVCLCAILSQDDIAVESEMEVSRAALAWIKYNTADRLVLLETVFACVRLGNMSSAELVRLGQDAPMLLENEKVRDDLLKANWVSNSSEMKLDCGGLEPVSSKPRKYVKHTAKAVVEKRSEINPVSRKPSGQSHTAVKSSGHDKSSGHGHKHETKLSMHSTHMNNNNSITKDTFFYHLSATLERQCFSDPMLDIKRLSSIWLSDADGDSYTCLRAADSLESRASIESIESLDSKGALESTNTGFMQLSQSLDKDIKPLEYETVPKSDEAQKVSKTVSIKENKSTKALPNKSIVFMKGLPNEDIVSFDPLARTKESNRLYYSAVESHHGENAVAIKALDINAGKSVSIATFPQNIMGFQTVYSRPYIYIIGGSINHMTQIQPINTIWRLHTTSGIWNQLPNMQQSRYLCCAVFTNEKLYAIGGIDGSLRCLQSMEVLDLADPSVPICDVRQWRVVLERGDAVAPKQWRQKAPMPGQRFGAAACVNGATIYVAGGATQLVGLSDDCLRSSVFAYQTKTDTWSRVIYLRRPRFRPIMTSFDGNLYVTGGMTSVDGNRFAKRVEVLGTRNEDPLPTTRWRKLGGVKYRRTSGHVLVSGHQLWIVGGCVHGEPNDGGANAEYVHVL